MNNKKYLVLDANALYSFIGRKKLGLPDGLKVNSVKLRRKFSNSYLFITSSVLTEVVTHFKNQKKILCMILTFLIVNQIYCIRVTENSVTQEDVNSLLISPNNTAVINRILDNKISIEVYFCCTLASILSSIIGECLVENEIKNKHLNIFLDKYFDKVRNLILDSQQLFINDSNLLLKDGYFANNEKKVMKQFYEKRIKNNLDLYEKDLYNILAKQNKTKKTLIDFQKELNLSKNSTNIFIKMASVASDYRKSKNGEANFDYKVSCLFNSWKFFNEKQKEYMISRIETYLSGSSIEKNDIYDVLFLGSYTNNTIESINKVYKKKGMPKCNIKNFHLISFDTNVSDFLGLFDKEGYLIADRLKIND